MRKIPIKFIATDKNFLDIAPRPVPSSKIVPTWYKNTLTYSNDKKSVDRYNDPNSTIKMCMPVTDSMNAGYTITLPCDVWVFNEGENKIKFQWAWDELKLVGLQSKEYHELYPVPDNHYTQVFKWTNYWTVKTPKNWSCLFTHPLHHDDFPFKTMTALVDTDKFPIPINLPFFLKKDFSGLIPKGTPLVQIIPFKREKFVSEFSWDEGNVLSKIWTKAHTEFFGRYLKNFRSQKTFEEGEVKKSKCPFHW